MTLFLLSSRQMKAEYRFEQKKDLVMIENNEKREPGTRLETGEDLNAPLYPRRAGAPWWLVVVLLVGLVGMAAYIAWMNSVTLKNRMNYLSEFIGSRKAEAELLSPTPTADSVAAWENSLLNSGALSPDSEDQEWKSSPEPLLPSTDSDPNQTPNPVSDFKETTPVAAPAESGYFIKAGEFSSRRAALERVKELRQGNYWGKVIEPDSAGGTYLVSVGEFTSFNKAKEKARTIGFILDIRTSVVKME